MNERGRIVEELLKREIVVEPSVVNYIIERGGLDFLPKFIEKYGNLDYIRLSQIKSERNLGEEENFKILIDSTEYPIGEGEADDFHQLFLDRFRRLSRIIRRRVQMKGYSEISTLKDGNVKTIGMVNDVRVNSSGYVRFQIEDTTGSVDCVYPDGKLVLNDEVIGVIGKYSGEKNRIYVEEIVRPGVSTTSRDKRIKEEISAAIISDIHIGSNKFLRHRWEKFLKWLKNDDAKNIKYLLIGGDLVDGIGIYPNQEKELEISDIYEQYESLSRYLEDIPDRIKIIMIPGNHDMVRVAEPQPALPTKIKNIFSSDIVFLSNPAYFVLHGYKILMYHGGSLNNFVDLIPNMSYERAGDMMKLMLEMRHLSPVYGAKVPVAPLTRDFLVIDIIPDVFITGHVHSFTHEKYRGVHLINASTWQSQTDYQKMMNFNPVPGKVAILDFHKDAVRIKEF